jgi:hypothetical protein
MVEHTGTLFALRILYRWQQRNKGSADEDLADVAHGTLSTARATMTTVALAARLFTVGRIMRMRALFVAMSAFWKAHAKHTTHAGFASRKKQLLAVMADPFAEVRDAVRTLSDAAKMQFAGLECVPPSISAAWPQDVATSYVYNAVVELVRQRATTLGNLLQPPYQLALLLEPATAAAAARGLKVDVKLLHYLEACSAAGGADAAEVDSLLSALWWRQHSAW